MNKEYLRTDEVADFVGSLNWTKLALEQAASDQASWKWVVLSLHSALQGALVCQLSGTAHLGALDQGTAYNRWFAWKMQHEGEEPKRPKLAALDKLVARLQDESKRTEGAGSVILLNSNEQDAIDDLHDLRNQFTHFQPQSWSFDLDGLPRLVKNVVGLISKIAADPWPFRRATVDQRKLISQLLVQLG